MANDFTAGHVPASSGNAAWYEAQLNNYWKQQYQGQMKSPYAYDPSAPLSYTGGKWVQSVRAAPAPSLGSGIFGIGQQRNNIGMGGINSQFPGMGSMGGSFGPRSRGTVSAEAQDVASKLGISLDPYTNYLTANDVFAAKKLTPEQVGITNFKTPDRAVDTDVEYAFDPRQYDWNTQTGEAMGMKPQMFGGSLSGIKMAGMGDDVFKTGSSLRGFASGGEVKGYADGGEYDPMNPDFAGQVRSNMDQNLLYNMREPQIPNVPVIAAAPAAPSAVQEALAQRRAILADLNKALIAQPAGSTMSDAEKYWRLAAAFGKTGKTGHFAESLSSVGDTMADITAEKRKEAKEQAALGLQRLQARSELANQQYALAREAEMQDLLKKYLTKGQQVTVDVTSGATQPEGGAAVPGLSDDLKALILAQPTDKAVSTLIDIAKENNKPSDLIKGINFLVANGSITRDEGAAIVKENLQGKLEQVDVNVPQLGGTFKMTGQEARSYYDKGILPARLGGKTTPAGTVEDTTVVPSAGTPTKPMSQEQAKAQETALQEQAKADIDEGKALVGQKQFATDQINASKRVLGLAKTNPKAFGLISDPGIFNAVTSLVETGVTTPWGSFSINVEEPLSKLKLKPEELQGRRQAIQALTQIEIGYRKLFLKGEGAVSNMEGQLAARLGPEIKDDPKTVQIKAGIIQIAAEKQNAVIDGFQKYKAKNPAAGPQAFYQTPEYKRIVDSYENKYKAFANKAGIPIDESLSNTPTKGGGSLVDSLKNDPRWNK